MKKVISISTDRNIFKEDSAVRVRQAEYGALFEELHIIVFTKTSAYLPKKVQIAPNTWVYGTHSVAKLFHISRAEKIAGSIIVDRKMSSGNSVVTVQDPFETGLVGARLKKKFGLPLHVQIHTDFLSPHFSRQFFLNSFRVRMAKKLLPQADAVRVVSKKIADSLSVSAEVKLKPGIVPTVLPIFVDINKFENSPATLDLKKKYSQFNFIILTASRLTTEKNIPLALEVFTKLVAIYPQIGLVIVGSGPEEVNLKWAAKQLGVEKSVIFEAWQNDLFSYYKTADLFLLTSNYEGYGLTLVEAVASRCPVVSTDVGIASELFDIAESSKNGSVCPIGGSECLFKSISQFIQNPDIRDKSVNESLGRLDRVLISDKSTYLKRYRESLENI